MSTACLILQDGTTCQGEGFGALAPQAKELTNNKNSKPPMKFSGEVVFNTGMSGYQEILTDPSYTGQMVLMTYPHIGNYGVCDEWSENGPEKGRDATQIKCSGFITRSLYTGPIPEGRMKLDTYLTNNGIAGITGVDTRFLTLYLRDNGAQNGVIVACEGCGIKDDDKKLALDYLNSLPSMSGQNLIGDVGTIKTEVINPAGSTSFAMLDCGIKMNIIREMVKRDCKVTLFPSNSAASDILDINPDGILFSNGPGDPGVLVDQVALVKELIGKKPVCGICLGHQMLGQAVGGKTYKMKFGHHGINQPVRDEKTGRVFVTSQNHGFAVDEESLPKGVTVRYRNANDGSVEGIEWEEKKLHCVQFHPEAAPGPVDSGKIFDEFVEMAKNA